MNNKILETLKVQPLSEEEKRQKHILGRLYGPIATCVESTRNGRRYNRELWEKALSDEITKEKIANKSLFLELGHPADREETDMTKVCACIPEMPKIVGDDLYAYVDILDTPNGKILKTLCDYGFVPGISSRGSGDIMANDEVDPDTFFLETWDIVQLPAVKKARLSVCESFDGKKPLKAVLQESYDAADEKDKKVIKESVENLLDIKLEESAEEVPYEDPEAPADDVLVEAEEKEEVDAVEDEVVEDEAVEEPTEEETDEVSTASEIANQFKDQEYDEITKTYTVGEMINQFEDYDKDLSLEFKPIVVDDKELPVTALEFDDTEEGKLVVTVIYNSEKSDNIDQEEVEAEEETVEKPVEDVEVSAEETKDEAIDDGVDEVIESLKETIRQKNELTEELKTLKQSKTVSDAEVEKLKEELNKYKVAFARTSEIAAKTIQLEKDVKNLNEQISLKDTKIKEFSTKADNTAKLNESVDAAAKQVKDLTEQLKTTKDDVAKLDEQLEAQKDEYSKKLAESTKVANSYKNKFKLVLNRYIESKAAMLGVKTTEITSRLNESYTLDDIDNICDELLDYSSNFGRLPFGNGSTAKVKVTESIDNKKTVRRNNPDYGYEIDDDLLKLAGLDDFK